MKPDFENKSFTSWSHFERELQGLTPISPVEGGRLRLWRGQRAAWPLSSAWERYVEARLSHLRGSERDAEQLRLKKVQRWIETRFRKHLLGTGGLRPKDIQGLELCWAYGRHYGLITPLLDWSESPYLALFLGLADLYGHKAQGNPGARVELTDEDEVVLYRLEVDPELANFQSRSGAFRVIDLNVEDSRLVAQKGLFTWLESDEHFCVESFLASIHRIDCLRTLTLKGRQILIEAGVDLRQHGIDWRTVFPDLQGAALATNALLNEIV